MKIYQTLSKCLLSGIVGHIKLVNAMDRLRHAGQRADLPDDLHLILIVVVEKGGVRI